MCMTVFVDTSHCNWTSLCTAGHLPKTVPTLCHMCLFYHVETNRTGKTDTKGFINAGSTVTHKLLYHWQLALNNLRLLNICQLTRQNRWFYLRMNSRGRCIKVPDGGISSCYPRTQRVCSERQSRPGRTARRPKLAPTSRLRQPVVGWAQHFRNCYH